MKDLIFIYAYNRTYKKGWSRVRREICSYYLENGIEIGKRDSVLSQSACCKVIIFVVSKKSRQKNLIHRNNEFKNVY